MEGAIQVQTAALQSQLVTQEWLASKMEHVAVTLNGHCTAVEELLAALTTTGQGFRAGLGVGLDSWIEMGPHREWGRIRVMREDAAEDKYK